VDVGYGGAAHTAYGLQPTGATRWIEANEYCPAAVNDADVRTGVEREREVPVANARELNQRPQAGKRTTGRCRGVGKDPVE
jgi:hypothetical protein